MKRLAHSVRGLALMAGVMVIGSLVISPSPAMAATITYNFSGTVTNVHNALVSKSPPFRDSGPLSVMTGTMTVDTTDVLPIPDRGRYTIQTFQVTIGTYTADLGSSGFVDIINVPTSDRFLATVIPSGPPVNSSNPSRFEILLFGPTNIFSSDALPDPAPSVSSFTTRQFRLGFVPSGGGPQQRVDGMLTSLTAVPLPTSVILFSVGLVALIGLRMGGLRYLRLPQA